MTVKELHELYCSGTQNLVIRDSKDGKYFKKWKKFGECEVYGFYPRFHLHDAIEYSSSVRIDLIVWVSHSQIEDVLDKE